MRFLFTPRFYDIIKCRGPALCRRHVNYYSTHTSVEKYLERATEITTGKHLLPGNNKFNGHRFKVSYIDERNASKSEQPIVVMLHGAPGTFRDFESQIDFMIHQGTRVIVPNIPALAEMLVHQYPRFRNSPRNRAELVHEFLQFLGVKKVDLLVAHSTSAYTAMCLQRDSERLSVRSLALLNPATYKEGILTPWWLFKMIEWLTYNRVGYAIMRFCQPVLFKTFFRVGQYTDVDEPLSSITSLTGRSREEALSMLHNLASSKLPLLFVFSENDKLVRADLSYDLVEVLGGSKSDVHVYNEQAKVVSKGTTKNRMTFVSFTNGSHFTMKKYADVVNRELLQLLNRRL